MKNALTIFRRELGSYFTSPVAYIFICAFLVFMGIFFFLYNGFFARANPELRSYYELLPMFFILLIPAVTMRLWSEERKSGTLELLMTMPLKSWEVVAGKFAASYVIIILTLALTFTVPLTVSTVVDIEWGVIIASYIGAVLMAGVYLAVGSWLSAMTQNQVVALLCSMVLLFGLWGIGLPHVVKFMVEKMHLGAVGAGLGWFGVYYHYEPFAKGLLQTAGFIYCLSMMGFFLVLNNFAVESKKY